MHRDTLQLPGIAVGVRSVARTTKNLVTIPNQQSLNRARRRCKPAGAAAVRLEPKLFNDSSAAAVEDDRVDASGAAEAPRAGVLEVTLQEISQLIADLRQLAEFVSGPLSDLQRAGVVVPLRQRLYQAIQATFPRAATTAGVAGDGEDAEEDNDDDSAHEPELQSDDDADDDAEDDDPDVAGSGRSASGGRPTGTWALAETLTKEVVECLHETATNQLRKGGESRSCSKLQLSFARACDSLRLRNYRSTVWQRRRGGRRVAPHTGDTAWPTRRRQRYVRGRKLPR